MRVSTTRILRVAAALTLGVTGLLGASPAAAANPDKTPAAVAAPTTNIARGISAILAGPARAVEALRVKKAAEGEAASAPPAA